MEYGVVFPHHEIGTDPGAIKQFAQGAEANGFTHLLIYDHVLGADPNRPGGFQGPYDKDTQFHEPFTLLSFLAAVTEKLDFITTVLILPQRQTALVAKQAAQLAVLSSNRFRLGIGTGWNTVEYEALGETFGNRGKRQAEQVELLRALWTEDSLTFNGKYHTVTQASINPRPSQPIPVWFGGGHPALLERCARLGDGWVPLSGPNDQAAAALDVMRTHRAAAGLQWDNFGIQAQAQYAGGDAAKWGKLAQRWRGLGCSHLALATHNAGLGSVDEHLRAQLEWRDAVG